MQKLKTALALFLVAAAGAWLLLKTLDEGHQELVILHAKALSAERAERP